MFPRMWIFNISEYDTIKIEVKNSNFYIIGTDDVNKLKRKMIEYIK